MRYRYEISDKTIWIEPEMDKTIISSQDEKPKIDSHVIGDSYNAFGANRIPTAGILLFSHANRMQFVLFQAGYFRRFTCCSTKVENVSDKTTSSLEKCLKTLPLSKSEKVILNIYKIKLDLNTNVAVTDVVKYAVCPTGDINGSVFRIITENKGEGAFHTSNKTKPCKKDP